MKMKLLGIAYRNIRRNIRRSLLSGIAIGVAAMSIVFLFALIQGMRDDMAHNLISYYTGEIRVRHAQYEQYERYNPIHLSVDWPTIDHILSQENSVTSYVPRITFPSLFYIQEGNHPVVGIGADFAREASFQDLSSILTEGRIPHEGANEMLLGVSLARNLKLSIGDRITLMSTTAARGSNAMTFQIVGLALFPVSSLNSQFFWAPIDRVQHLLRMGNEVQDVLIQVEGNEKKIAQELKRTLEGVIGEELDVRSYSELNLLYSFIELAQYIYYAIGVFFLLLGSTVIINTTMMVIYERMREIGTLGAMGMHKKELTRLFFLEGAIISAIGAAVGVLVGVITVIYLGRVGINFTDAMSGIDMEISSVLYPRFSLWTTIIVYIYSVVVASVATLFPSRRASRIEIVEALRYV